MTGSNRETCESEVDGCCLKITHTNKTSATVILTVSKHADQALIETKGNVRITMR